MKGAFAMNHNLPIGEKIKALRNANNLTLKQLGEMTNLSVGFLSQMERGMSSIAIDTLEKIASVLNVSLTSFFEDSSPTEKAAESADPVIHRFAQHATPVSSHIIQTVLSKDVMAFDLLPRLFDLMPFANDEEEHLEMYSHKGEEFIYILEGIVTIHVDGRQYILYLGDCIQIHSNEEHNWRNCTNRTARLLSVNVPNPFRHPEEGHIMPL